VITGFTLGRVIRSKDGNYKEGDIVLNAFSPVAEHYVVPAELLIRKVDPTSGVPLPDFLSSLGNIQFLGFVFQFFFFFFFIPLKLYFLWQSVYMCYRGTRFCSVGGDRGAGRPKARVKCVYFSSGRSCRNVCRTIG
jgi:hypothetical protein